MTRQIYESLLHSGHMVQQADMTSSIPNCERSLGPPKTSASYTLAMCLLRERKQAQVAGRGEGGGE